MMAMGLVFLCSLLTLHSVQGSLNEKQRPLSPICHGPRCPPGYSTYCLPGQTNSTRCIPCVQGTFSTHASRRKACRPCSRCGDNQFESSPCTRTSNVVCQECSHCPPGIEVAQSCGKTTDTVCRRWSRSPVQFADVLRTYKKPQIGEAFLFFLKKRKENLKPKDKMAIIEAENPPWLNGTRTSPKQPEKRPSRFPVRVQPTTPTPYSTSTNGSETKQAVPSGGTSSGPVQVVTTTSLVAAGISIGAIPKDKMAIIEAENPPWLNGTRTSPKQPEKGPSGFSVRVQPTPPTPYSTSTDGPETKQAVPSGDTSSGSFEVLTTTSLVAAGISIGALLNDPTVSTVFSPKVKSESDTDTRHTRQHAHYNGTRKATSSPPRKPQSKLPLEGVITATMSTIWGMSEVFATEYQATVTSVLKSLKRPSGNTTAPDNIVLQRLYPEDGSKSGSVPDWLPAFITTGLMALVATLIAFKVYRKKFLRRKRCCFGCRPAITHRAPRWGSPDCCEGNSVSSVSSVPAACAVDHENDGNPKIVVTSTNETEHSPNPNQTTVTTSTSHDDLSTIPVKADVHRTVFHVFPPEGETGEEGARSYPQVITYAENLFTNNGGTLSHPDSNVEIKIENNTISEGTPQRIFFGVVYNDMHPTLLQNIPKCETCEKCKRTLISPVIQCGPEDISLSKPVEIVLPHCLYVDEVKKTSIRVFRCGQFSENGPMKWEEVPSASEKNCQSKSWFTVKKDTIHIKTKTFSLWCVFACGGPKRMRATVFAHKPNADSDVIFLRFYIYPDNEDSKKRVERIEKERFPQSKPATTEKPFKMCNDGENITVWLDPETLARKGWKLDQTPAIQTYKYEDGYRSYESCAFAVKPSPGHLSSVDCFSCILYYQQGDNPEHFLYVNPGITPLAHKLPPPMPSMDRFFVNSSNEINSVTQEQTSSEDQSVAEPHAIAIPEDLLERGDELVTEEQFLSICLYVGSEWKIVLRHLGMVEAVIKNLDEDHKFEKVNEKCYQGLLEWKTRIGSQDATMRKLCDALHKAGCSKALEKLSKRDIGQRLAPIPESTSGLGTSTCV